MNESDASPNMASSSVHVLDQFAALHMHRNKTLPFPPSNVFNHYAHGSVTEHVFRTITFSFSYQFWTYNEGELVISSVPLRDP